MTDSEKRDFDQLIELLPKLKSLAEKASEIEGLLHQLEALRIEELQSLLDKASLLDELLEKAKASEGKLENKPFLELPHPRARKPELQAQPIERIWVVAQARSRLDNDDNTTRVSVKQVSTRFGRALTPVGDAFDVVLQSPVPAQVEPDTVFSAWLNHFPYSYAGYPTLRDQWVGDVSPPNGFWARITNDYGTGTYDWEAMDYTGQTPVNPAITGTSSEVNGHPGVPVGEIVWMTVLRHVTDAPGIYTSYHFTFSIPHGMNASGSLLTWSTAQRQWRPMTGTTGGSTYYLTCTNLVLSWQPIP